MRSRRDTPQPDARVAVLVAAQHGIADRADLHRCGLDRFAIARRVAAGRLHEIHPGVFALSPVLTREARYLSAVRACGRDAVLSHRAAADLWGLRRDASTRFDVTVPFTSGVRSNARIRVHRARRPVEWMVRDAIPVTTPARTLADLAEVVPHRALEKALESAHARDLLDLRAIDAVAAAQPGRRGPALVRRLVRLHDVEHSTRSALEDAFLALCDRYDVPRPAVNARIDGMEVDCCWHDARLVVELDSWEWHGTRTAFRGDRTKSRRLTALGWTVARIAGDEIDETPAAVAREVLALIARGRAAAA